MERLTFRPAISSSCSITLSFSRCLNFTRMVENVWRGASLVLFGPLSPRKWCTHFADSLIQTCCKTISQYSNRYRLDLPIIGNYSRAFLLLTFISHLRFFFVDSSIWLPSSPQTFSLKTKLPSVTSNLSGSRLWSNNSNRTLAGFSASP